MFANNNDKIVRLLEGCAEAQRTDDGRNFYRDDINTYVSLSGCGVDYARNIPDATAIQKLTRVGLNTFVMFNGGNIVNDVNWQPTANEAGAINRMKYSIDGEYTGMVSTVINKTWQIVPDTLSLMGLPVVGNATEVYQGSKTNSLDLCVNAGAAAGVFIRNNLTGRISVRRHDHYFLMGAGGNFVALGDHAYRIETTPVLNQSLVIITGGITRPLVEGMWFEVNGGFAINTIVPFTGAIRVEYELFSCQNIPGNDPIYSLAENPVMTREFVSIVDRLQDIEISKRPTVERFCQCFGLALNNIDRLGRIGTIDDSNLLTRILNAYLAINLERN